MTWAVLLLNSVLLNAQAIDVDVNLNIKHKVDTVTTFHRSKFVTIHADVVEPEWDSNFGPNFTSDVRDDFLNGYDVYLGRNTGGFQGAMRGIPEDPARVGYPHIPSIEAAGIAQRDWYAARDHFFEYESRNSLVLASQLNPFWPNGDEIGNMGWSFSQEDTPENPFGTASGEFMAHYIKNYFGDGGTDGQPRPTLVEVINEPIWHLVDIDQTNDPIDVFNFHNGVAEQVKLVNPNVQIGGYCTAFPDFEKRNFDQWHERWKLFMDVAGDNMDFWAIHLYDFPAFGNKKLYRKGSNMEATMDMLDHYSYLSFGEAKDIMVSEYGAQVHNLASGPWSPYRDWLHIVSSNAMMMQFMERSDHINSTINFIPIKATWGTSGVDDTFVHRLMRRANEPESYTGEWVYTDYIKFFDLWREVKGARIDSRSSDLDILVDAYVNGDEVFVILNNLAFEDRSINLHLFEDEGLTYDALLFKHLYLDDSNVPLDSSPILESTEYSSDIPEVFTLKPESTIVLKYTMSSDVTIDELLDEVRYYATDYLKPIQANTPITYQINGINSSTYGEAVLRLGIGREHGLSVRPSVKVNGTQIHVPLNFRGDDQKQRDSFFGVIEIDVPYAVLQTDNTVEVEFSDDGGHLSSVILQVSNFSHDVIRTTNGAVTGVTVTPSSAEVPLNGGVQLEEMVAPLNATNPSVTWSSADPLTASVDASGYVTGLALGSTEITVTTVDGDFTDVVTVDVLDVPGTISVDDRDKYLTTEYVSGETIEVIVDYEAGTGNTVTDVFGGVQVLLREILPDWTGVANDYTFSATSAIGTQNGVATVEIDLTDVPASEDLPEGNFYFLFPRFNASNGIDFKVDGLAPITILSANTVTNVGESFDLEEIIIYPNPSKGQVSIRGNRQAVNVSIRNYLGIEVYQKEKVLGDHQIDVSHLPSGIYYVTLDDGVRSKILKSVIMK